MSATQERQAAPGTTPVHSVLGHEERITRMERENAELRELVTTQALCMQAIGAALDGGLRNVRQCIRVAALTDMAHNERLTRLEAVGDNDRCLSDVLAGIEDRLKRIELGTELLP